MEFKDILVHIDDSQQCAARLELAIKIAVAHQANLTGLYVITHPHYTSQGEAQLLKVTHARQLFESLTAGADIHVDYLCVDWAVSGDNMVDVINNYAHQKDLVVVGQTGHDRMQVDGPADLPERVVMGSGRPVLVVPYTGIFNTVGERVLVAWKAGRASARAVNDAMPFLFKAKEVLVVTAMSPGERNISSAEQNADICSHLKRHAITVLEDTFVTGDVSVNNVLMNYAWEHGCDLLVMGIAAHSSHGPLAVRPVTKEFFEHMTVPVLISH
ncbi:MAG: universal stress protein [Desulfuromonadaceae bacterium]|nr:universal stress protein [Desulfuromonadaceae bacterium]